MASGLDLIDWTAPWYAPWRRHGEAVLALHAKGLSLTQALNMQKATPVRFVQQVDLPEDTAYETFIRETGQVPTREGLHDFFNALCWMHFPQAKARLNRLQSDEIARAGVSQVRGAVRDAVTVFDENAVLIQAPDALWQALTQHHWQEALVDQRAAWTGVRLWMFGHATLEKLVKPYKSITAHLWRVPDAVGAADLDSWLAQDLQADKLAAKPFSPLPLLGVPDWCLANTDPAFYADPSVFRPKRMRHDTSQKPCLAAQI